MRIETERLIIRPLHPDDLEDFFAYRSDPEVCRFQGYDPFTRAEAVEYLESMQSSAFGTPEEWSQLGIEQKILRRLIGDIGLRPDKDPTLVEFGISFSPEFQGKGFAGEALAAVTRYLFKQSRVQCITGVVDVENLACIRLMERIGFSQVGHYLKSFNDHGEWRDEYVYALLETNSRNS